jgi:hypothetical protein
MSIDHAAQGNRVHGFAGDLGRRVWTHGRYAAPCPLPDECPRPKLHLVRVQNADWIFAFVRRPVPLRHLAT